MASKELKKINKNNSIDLLNKFSEVLLSEKSITEVSFVEAYDTLINTVKVLSDLKTSVDAKIKAEAKEKFESTGENSIVSNGYRFTYVAPTTKESFDSKKYKSEHPGEYVQYVKVSNVSDSVRITKQVAEK